MDEKYEKLYSYGKSLTQDLQVVQDHLYQALCQSEAEKAAEAKRFEEEISRLKQQLVDQRTASDCEIQRLNDLLEQEKLDAQTLTQKVDEQVTDLQNNVIRVVSYQNFLAGQQVKIERKESELKAIKEDLDEREEELEKEKEELEEAKGKLAEKSHKIEKENKSKKELRDQIHQLEVDNDKYQKKLEELNQKFNDKCRENENLQIGMKNLELESQDILREQDGKISQLEKELATYKRPGEPEKNDKIESSENDIPLTEEVNNPMQDDSDK